MIINGVTIEDTFAEAFTMRVARGRPRGGPGRRHSS